MDKKGQGLPLTTIILAILVVVVLIVLIAFFLGGSSSIFDSIKRVFFGTTAGYDLNLAIQTCQSRCESAKELPSLAKPKHAFCTSSLAVDYSPVDGEADFVKDGNKKKTVKYYCPPKDPFYNKLANVPSSYPEDQKGEIGFLNIPCEIEVECERPTGWPKGVQQPG